MQVDDLLLEVTQMDALTFWSRQFAEHALFLAKGFQAGQQELETLGLDNHVDEGMRISDLWMDIFNRRLAGQEVAPQEIFSGLDLLDGYLIDSYNVASQTWVGYNYPEVIKHYQEEFNYFNRYLREEEITEAERIAFWTEIHKDHAALFARLLDPSEKEDFQQSLLYQQLFENTLDILPLEEGEIEQFVTLSQQITDFNNFTATLREQQALGQLKSVIHPRLALHIHREGLRSIAELGL